MKAMKIAIIGATGGSGRFFVDLATRAGHHVTALARTPSKLDDVDGITVLQADGRDLDSVQTALSSQKFDVVVNIVGASTFTEARTCTDLYSVANQNIMQAMKEHGIQRVVAVTSTGVEPHEGEPWFFTYLFKPLFFKDMYTDMQQMESDLRDSDLEYTIVRPPFLTHGEPTGEYRVSVGKCLSNPKSLRRGDVGHFLLRAVQDPETYKRQVVEVSE